LRQDDLAAGEAGRGAPKDVLVRAGLVPGIHEFLSCNKDVDGRDKPGRDEK
jgi:hypothetical protein